MIYILCIVIFVILLKYCDVKDIYNPVIFFLLNHFFFLFIALLWAKEYEVLKGVYISDGTVFYVIYGMVVSTFIVAANNKLRRKRKIEYTLFNEWKMIESRKNEIISVIPLFFIGVLFWLIFVLKAKQIPIFNDEIENFRVESREGMGYVTIISMIFTTYSGLYLSIGLKNFFWKVFVLIFSCFILISFGNRSPMFSFVLFYLILLTIKHKIKINLKKVVPLGLIGYLLLVLLGAYRMNVDADLSTRFFLTIGWRPYVNISNLDNIITRFSDFLYGMGYWIDLYVLAPGYAPNLGTWIKEALQYDFDGGSVTITYLGDAFVNFGVVGLIIYPILYPVIYIKLNNYFRKIYLRDNSIHVGHAILFIAISYNLGGAISSGILSPILYGILPIYVVYKLHCLLSGRWRI